MRALTNPSFARPPASRQGGTEMTSTAAERRELAHRTSDGIEITLFWSKSSSQVTIAVLDIRSDEALEFDVDGRVALDAFNHPYAYAATRRVRSVVPLRVAVTD
jgi:hypothetical protein